MIIIKSWEQKMMEDLIKNGYVVPEMDTYGEELEGSSEGLNKSSSVVNDVDLTPAEEPDSAEEQPAPSDKK